MMPTESSVSGQTLAEARAMVSSGATVEEILRLLKDRGANAIASIRAIEVLLGLSTREAQRALYESESWRDMR